MKADPTRQQDQALLQRFAEKRDEDAFRALVGKYTSLVFGVAMRRTRDAQAAEEVLQLVFLALAKKAASLSGQRSLGAWLHRAATLESLKSIRQDATRNRHLNMIRDQHDATSSGLEDERVWSEVRPHLDQLLNRLPATDREILVLHFFDGLQFAEVANVIGMTAAAAQKRSVRALKKLAGLLRKRGVIVPLAALTSGLGVELAPAAPASLATSVASEVLATAPLATASAFSFSNAIIAMTTTKIALAATFIIAAAIPVGIKISSANAAASTQIEAPVEVVRKSSRRTTSSKFEPAEFRQAVEQLIASDTDYLVRKRRLQRLLFSLDIKQVRAAITVLEEFEDPQRIYEIIGAAYARWGELDPESAIADAISRPPARWGYYPLHGVWDTWAFSDWDAASEWVVSTKTDYDHSFLFWGYFDNMAAIDGALAVEHAKLLGEGFRDRADQYLSSAIQAWTSEEPKKAIEWISENLTDEVERDKILGSALESLGQSDAQEALSHTSLISNKDRLQSARYNIFWGWALQKPLDAADHFVELKAGENWDRDTVRSAAEAIARNQPERAIEISRTIQNAENLDSFYCGILCGAKQSDFQLVMEAADGISSEAGRTNASLRTFIRDWAALDRAAAAAWVEALPKGAKKRDAQQMFPGAE